MLYQVLRIPVEAVLGKDGVGLADCAIAESKFEKGEVSHTVCSHLSSGQGDSEKERRILNLQ